VKHPPSQRAFPRVPIGYRVKVVTQDRMIGYSRALNISLGGILLDSEPPLPLGSRVGVAIFLSDREGGSRIVTHGIVVRADSRGNAIAFTPDMEEEHVRALALLVVAHLSPTEA
jgi:PilZ domain